MLMLLIALLAQDPATAPTPAPAPTQGRIPFNVQLNELTRPAPVAVDSGAEVPGWALTDPARWERLRCGANGDEACRRAARNRLAVARASMAERAEPASPSRPHENCRMVTQWSESGFGGSFTRVCGDGASVERAREANQAMLDDLRERTEPRDEPCDRPMSHETQDQRIGRCRATPP
jgi:hypothetical protein